MRDAWSKRGEDYTPGPFLDGETTNIVNWIRESQLGSILEVGSGWGRIYSLLEPLGLADNFWMCDFVDSMRRGCQEKTGILPEHWDGITLPYEDNSFDMVLSYAVLQHVPRNKVNRVFSEYVRVARRYVYVADWLVDGGVHGCTMFRHNYAELFHRFGVDIARARGWRHKSAAKHHWMIKVDIDSINWRGHEAEWRDGVEGIGWYYSKTDELADHNCLCARCGRPPTAEGYDACLGYIPGAASACCGHGVEPGYTMMKNV